MEPEQTTSPVESVDRFENLRKVTPLSKYLAMVLFILMPFAGGWIGYTYAPEKVVEVEKVLVHDAEETIESDVIKEERQIPRDGEPSKKLMVVSMRESEDESFVCSHIGLNELESSLYENWPVYTAVNYGVSFSYPPNLEPNFEDLYTDDKGDTYLSVGYNPNIGSVPGKPIHWDLDSTWMIEIRTNTTNVQKQDSNYCSVHRLCLMEEVNYSNDFYTYVSTFDEPMMGSYLREYSIYSHEDYNKNLEIRVSSAAASGSDAPVCAAVMSVTNLDKIAHSIKLRE